MSKTSRNVDFFLAANSPLGFVSFFDELRDPRKVNRLLIVKGGPGCGKSTLMRRLAEGVKGNGVVERLHCSGDPASLDGVWVPQLKLGVVDGTAPHVVEPVYPGAVETVVNLYDYLDENQLTRNREEILHASEKNREYLRRSSHLIAAAGALTGEIAQISQPFLWEEKILRYGKSLAKKWISHRLDTPGQLSHRFLTCIAAPSEDFLTQNLPVLCPHAIVLHDRWGSAGRLFLKTLKEEFLQAGYDVIACPCPMAPHTKLEHLYLPQLGLGIFTSNEFHPLAIPGAQNIHAQRFLAAEGLEEKKSRIRFQIKAAKTLLEQAGQLIGEAKRWHDQLEKYYIGACDFGKIDQLLRELKKRYL